MAHYTIHRSDSAGVARLALDAICPDDQTVYALAARLLEADGRAEVRRGNRCIAVVLTTAAVLPEIKSKRSPRGRKAMPIPAPTWGRPDLFSPVEIPA